MSDVEPSNLADWWAQLTTRDDSIDRAYQALENAGVLNKVTVHRYICRKRGCVIGTVIRVAGATICRTRDYKLSPGLNASSSVEDARRRNTLDGNRHWPGHTYDVAERAALGPKSGMDMNCRHVFKTILAVDILAAADGVVPGHPGAPTLL